MTIEEEAGVLANRLLLVIAGQRVEVAWRATHEVFTGIIALSADTLGEAKRSARAAGKDLVDSVTTDWAWYRQQAREKASASREGNA